MAKDAKGAEVIGFLVPRKLLARLKALQTRRSDLKLSETLRYAVKETLDREGVR
jgi:hypothetical protein